MDTLHDIRQEVREALEEHLGMLAYGPAAAQSQAIFETATDLFQAMAACNLLLYFDAERFRKHLVFSGYARRYHLTQYRAEEGSEGEGPAISRTEAFFNVLVAHHHALASELVALSPAAWQQEAEYEDDYCYYAFFHHFALAPAAPDRTLLKALLEQFEGALEGGASPRLDVCRAFYEREAMAFEEAFEALLETHEEWIAAHKDRRAFDPVFLMRCRLFTEGIALLTVAERVGFPVRPEYRYCPSVARLATTTTWPPDLFKDIHHLALQERRARQGGPQD